MYPILSYFTEQGVNIAHIDGAGTVGQVHDRIDEELERHNLTSEAKRGPATKNRRTNSGYARRRQDTRQYFS